MTPQRLSDGPRVTAAVVRTQGSFDLETASVASRQCRRSSSSNRLAHTRAAGRAASTGVWFYKLGPDRGGSSRRDLGAATM